MSNTRSETDPQLRVVLHPEDLARLALEHQRAARRGPDDVDAVAGVRREPLREPVDVAARVVEQPVGLQRQAAAALLGDVDREAVVLEQRDGHLAEPRLVVVRPAAVEEGDAPRPRRAARASCAQRWNVRPAKRGIGASRWMPMTRSTAARSSRLRSDQLASGAAGVPSRPASVGPREDAVAQRERRSSP